MDPWEDIERAANKIENIITHGFSCMQPC
jgi:hypothetical protein